MSQKKFVLPILGIIGLLAGLATSIARADSVLTSLPANNDLWGIAFTNDGHYLYGISTHRDIVKFDMTSPSYTKTSFPRLGGDANMIAMAPQGGFAYIAGGNSIASQKIFRLNLADDTQTGITLSDGSLSGPGEIYDVGFTPDGRYAFVTDVGKHQAFRINTTTNTQVGSAYSIPGVIGVVASNSYAYIFSSRAGTNHKDALYKISVADGTMTGPFDTEVDGSDIGHVIIGNYLYAVGANDNKLVKIDLRDFTSTAYAINPAEATGGYGLAITPDTHFAYIANWDFNTVDKFDLRTHSLVQTIPIATNSPWVLALSPDSQKLAVAVNNNAEVNPIYLISTGWVSSPDPSASPSPSPTATPTVQPSFFTRITYPTISQSKDLVTCTTGTYNFYYHGSNEGLAVPTKQVVDLLADGKVVKTTESLAIHVSFARSELSTGSTYTCRQTISQKDAAESFTSVNYSIQHKAEQDLRSARNEARAQYWSAVRAAMDARHASIDELIKTHDSQRTNLSLGEGLKVASAVQTMKLITTSWHSDQEKLVANRHASEAAALKKEQDILEKAGVSLLL